MPNEHDISTVEGRAKLKELCEKAPEGPWFVSSDEAADCPDHENSGLATVEGSSDWPIARLCEWHAAEFIAAARTALPAALAQIEADKERIEALEVALRIAVGDALGLQAKVEALARERDQQRVILGVEGVTEKGLLAVGQRLIDLEKELEEARKLAAWTAVEDGLPSVGGTYLVLVAGMVHLGYLVYFENGPQWSVTGKWPDREHYVTHWTGIPVLHRRAALNEPAPPAPQPEKYERTHSRVYINGFKAGVEAAIEMVERTGNCRVDRDLVENLKCALREAGEPAPKGEQG